MARSRTVRDRLQRQVLELRDHVNLVDRALMENQDDADVMRSLAMCRAKLNGLLTDVTQTRFRFKRVGRKRVRPTPAPRWKSAAARFTE
ncbi:MAG: hypothetical protein OER88_11585 [Planctomycetota bacterium]|nr:hypothetical protein [Planctomycetota bacterium]